MIKVSLEEKIGWLTDRAQIAELIAAYAHTVDDRDFAAWQDLFAADGGYGNEPNRIPKPLLAEAGEEFLRPYPKSHHFLGLPAIEINGDKAEARCPGVTHHVKIQKHPSQSSIVGGWLRLTFRRTEVGWRIVDAAADIAWTEGGDYVGGAGDVVGKLVGQGS